MEKTLKNAEIQVQSIFDLNYEIKLSFLSALSVNAIFLEIKQFLGDHEIVKEELKNSNVLNGSSLKEIKKLLSKNKILRKKISSKILVNTKQNNDYDNEGSEFLKKFKKTKSQVVKKGMLKSLFIKNILLSFYLFDSLNVESSF